MNELIKKLILFVRWCLESKQDKFTVPAKALTPITASFTLSDNHVGRTLAFSGGYTVTIAADSDELTFPVGSAFEVANISSSSATVKAAANVKIVGGSVSTPTTAGSVTVAAHTTVYVWKYATNAWQVM